MVDFFGGSGSTLIACENTGRTCAMIELEPKWCDVIVRRYIKTTGDNNVRCVRQGQELPREEIAGIDQAAAKKLMHKNAAAHKKSALMKKLAAASK